MKVMELDGIIDTIEEFEHSPWSSAERWDLRDFLYEILSKYSYEDRENNIEIKLEKVM